MTEPVTPQFLDAFAEAWSRHDAEAIVSMMTSDCVMFLSSGQGAEGSRHEGRDAVRAAAEALFARFPGARWTNPRHFIAGDRGVSEWRFVATTVNGEHVETNGCDVFTFRDGLIAVKDSYRKSIVA